MTVATAAEQIERVTGLAPGMEAQQTPVDKLLAEAPETKGRGWVHHDLQLGPAELHIIKLWARRSGMDLNAWIRKAIRSNLPVSLREAAQKGQFLSAAAMQGVVNENRGRLKTQERRDAERHAQAQSVYAVHPVDDVPGRRELLEKIAKGQQSIVDLLNKHPIVRTHTCAFLHAYYPDGYTPNTCKGSCASPRQTGAICQWAGGVAKNCQHFAPRHNPRRR